MMIKMETDMEFSNGHTTPQMAMYYVNLAKMDFKTLQRRASPVDIFLR